MIDSFEPKVRKTLRQLARQRIRMVLRPGNYWVIERAIARDDDTDAALLTCYMRGWIEPLEHAVPSSKLTNDGKLPPNFQFDRLETLYRLTSAGWSVIQRSNTIAVCALFISVLSFALSVGAQLLNRGH